MGTTDQVERVDQPYIIDVTRIQRMLAYVWGNRPGYVGLPVRNGGWHENMVAYGGNQAMLPTFDLTMTSEHYWCPLVFATPHRVANQALPTNVLWADLDAADPRGVRLRPSCAWETSGGDFPHYQALWFLTNEVTADEAAQLSRRIAYAEPGCDRSGWDVTQVLRLPGTLNHKYDPPQPIRLLWAKKTAYTVAEVERTYPPVAYGPMSTADFPIFRPMFGDPTQIDLNEFPVGVRYALSRLDDGRDRSAELFKLATLLLDFNAEPAVAVELLRRSPMNKFAGRADEIQRLRETVSAAMERKHNGRSGTTRH